MNDSEIFIAGANGQLGKALQQKYPGAQSADIDELDITNSDSVSNFNWNGIRIILNAAAYTNVDGAESPEGRIAAWKVNASAVLNLVRAAQEYDLLIVHISTDYVFDGSQDLHRENEAFSPLSVYGQSKAAGDLVVSMRPKHYILRTSWVIGEGNNFVRTMLGLGQQGTNPKVVADQRGRLTFTSELVKAIDHLLMTKSPYGTYNISNSGDVVSWAEITRTIFQNAGFNLTVTDTTTAEYYAGKEGIAPRPSKSGLNLDKIKTTGFQSTDWREALSKYIDKELKVQ